jgi:hypothetical protein
MESKTVKTFEFYTLATVYDKMRVCHLPLPNCGDFNCVIAARAKLSTTEQVAHVSGVLGVGENYFFEANAVKQKNGIEIEVSEHH